MLPSHPSSSSARPYAAAVGLSALLIPVLWIAVDLASRAALFPTSDASLRRTYALGALLSLLVWGLLMEAARHPRRAVRAAALAFLAFLAAFGIGLQALVHGLTRAYVGRRALMLALGIPDLARAGYFLQNGPRIAALCLAPAALAVALAVFRARRLGFRRVRPTVAAFAAAAVVLVTMFAPLPAQGFQCLPPDVLWLNGTGAPLLYAAGLLHRPRSLPVGHRAPLPAAPPVAASAPSIVLLLGESVRRDAVCLPGVAACADSPRVAAAAPERVGYARAFAVASCTELATSTLWTGLPIDAAPESLARAPLLWDYARARGYRAAYLTSQNLLYQQQDLFLRTSGIDRLREARDRAADAPVDEGSPDEALTAEALAFLDEAEGPALLVVHHANSHAPYRQVAGFTPFATAGVADAEARRNRYRNAIVHEDALVGELVAQLRRSPRGRGAIVIYTSDHGEAWGEHGAFTHSFDLHAEQTDVPLWIDAPPGSLPDETRARLRRDAPVRPVATEDLAATLIDLLGAADVPAFADLRARVAGTSLLREPPPARDVLLWNCPPTRECPVDAFGVVRWPLKLQWIGHDSRYACHDLEVDPAEASLLPAPRCAALREAADRVFGARAEAGGP